MKIVNRFMLALLLLVLVACATHTQEEKEKAIPTGGEKEMRDIWEFEVEVAQVDKELQVDMSLENISGKGQTLVFPTSQVYDITLTNEKGDMIYRHSDHYMYTQQIVEVYYKADQKREMKEKVSLENIPAGAYTVSVYLTPSKEVFDVLGDPDVFTRTMEIDIQ